VLTNEGVAAGADEADTDAWDVEVAIAAVNRVTDAGSVEVVVAADSSEAVVVAAVDNFVVWRNQTGSSCRDTAVGMTQGRKLGGERLPVADVQHSGSSSRRVVTVRDLA